MSDRFHQPAVKRRDEPRHHDHVDVFLQRGGGQCLVHSAEDFENRVDALFAMRAERTNLSQRAIGVFLQAGMPDHGGQGLQRWGQPAELFRAQSIALNRLAPLRPQRFGDDRRIEPGSDAFGTLRRIVAEAEGRIWCAGFCGPLQQVEKPENLLVTDARGRHQIVQRLREQLAHRAI